MTDSEQGANSSRAQRRTEAGFAFALLCLVVSGGLSSYSLHRLDVDNAWVDHTYQVIGGMDAFTLSLTNAEAAQRGFIITGDPAYLEPLEQRFDATRRSAQRLMALTQDNADQQQRLASLPALVSQRFADL